MSINSVLDGLRDRRLEVMQDEMSVNVWPGWVGLDVFCRYWNGLGPDIPQVNGNGRDVKPETRTEKEGYDKLVLNQIQLLVGSIFMIHVLHYKWM